jgi:hypothetical protein
MQAIKLAGRAVLKIEYEKSAFFPNTQPKKDIRDLNSAPKKSASLQKVASVKSISPKYTDSRNLLK